jgi:predicted RNA-binding protein associated with RNAse of E/G family
MADNQAIRLSTMLMDQDKISDAMRTAGLNNFQYHLSMRNTHAIEKLREQNI